MVTALIAGLALSATAVVGYRSAGELFEVAGLGQADTFLRSLRRSTELSKLTGATLAEYLEENDDLGLRYIAFLDPTGMILVEAGHSIGKEIPLPANPRERVLERVENRFRYSSLIPTRLGRRMALPTLLDRPMRRMFQRETEELSALTGPTRLVMEFEPVLWRQLKLRSTLTMIAALGASCLLVATAMVFWKLTKNAEEAKAAQGEQRRLAALGEMTAVLAHEIKNPLAALKGHAQLLEETLPEESADKKKAALVVGEAVRLQRLVNELLDFVRSNRLNLRPEEASSVLREASEMVDSERITLLSSTDSAIVLMDRPRIVQALANLLTNALQASPEGDKITAGVEIRGTDLVFTVADNGEGIPTEDLEKIFEPFHTGRVRGVGLGLAVAKKIVEAHGGRINAINRPNAGALFSIEIPVKRGE